MAAEWATAEITVLEYRDTGTFVIKLDEAVLQQLDDHIGARAVQAVSHCIRHQMSQPCNFAHHAAVVSVPTMVVLCGWLSNGSCLHCHVSRDQSPSTCAEAGTCMPGFTCSQSTVFLLFVHSAIHTIVPCAGIKHHGLPGPHCQPHSYTSHSSQSSLGRQVCMGLLAVMTQSMAFSPYKKPFEERLMRWEAQLSLVSEVIDEWLALQRAWMYLEPIFSSPDILQQLPQEGKKYSSVDRIWRKVSSASKGTSVAGLLHPYTKKK